jgi:hypothetical protein
MGPRFRGTTGVCWLRLAKIAVGFVWPKCIRPRRPGRAQREPGPNDHLPVMMGPRLRGDDRTEIAARPIAMFTISNSPSRSRGAFLRPGFASLLRSPQSRGGRSAERRSGACEAPVGHAMTRHVRRLRGALRPITRDARLSALHRGGFGLPGPRFSHRTPASADASAGIRIGYSELLAARS